jgi:hypothetical protein
MAEQVLGCQLLRKERPVVIQCDADADVLVKTRTHGRGLPVIKYSFHILRAFAQHTAMTAPVTFRGEVQPIARHCAKMLRNFPT